MSHPPPANDFDGLLSDDEEEAAAPAPAGPADAAFAARLQSQLVPAGAPVPHPPPPGMLPQQAAWMQVRQREEDGDNGRVEATLSPLGMPFCVSISQNLSPPFFLSSELSAFRTN